MTRTTLITQIAFAAVVLGGYWWAKRQPVEAPVATTEGAFVSAGPCPVGFWARFDGDRYTCWKDDPQGPCPQGQQWQSVNYTDGGSGYACVEPSFTVSTGGVAMVAIAASDGPISDTAGTATTLTCSSPNPCTNDTIRFTAPERELGPMLVFDSERLELIIGTSGMPIAWIEPTGGPNGKPRVRIRNGRVADTVRALALMAITPRPAHNVTVWCGGVKDLAMISDKVDPAVAEWVRGLEK